MGSISSSLANTPVTTAGSGSSNTFKGASAYSSDFQNIIDRAVAIANLPISLLSSQQTTLNNQLKELTTLDTKFAALQSAVNQIGTALSGSSFQTSVSSDNVVDISVADGAGEGVYSMKVSDIGAYETSLSSQAWNVANASDPLNPTTFTLVVGNRNYSVTMPGTDNSAQAVVNAINASCGSVVQATTVMVKPGETSISLKSKTLGQTNLDILQIPANATPTSLQTQAASSYAISRTSASWDASGDTPATYSLVIGGDQFAVTPAGNSADQVAFAINNDPSLSSKVTASVVDLGTGGNHDYRISLESAVAGPMNGSMTLDLNKSGGPSLQTQQIAWTDTADAANSRSTYNMVIGGKDYSFTPADNSAASVTAAINAVYGADVHAAVADFGTGGSHDYRISLQSAAGSPIEFDIQKTIGAKFQAAETAATTGRPASYQINNSGVTNTSTTRNITISNGVTATLVGTSTALPSGSVDITVMRPTSTLGTALSGFATAYNAIVDEIATQRGQAGGALAGQSVLSQLSSVLSGISTYSSGGQFTVLKDLGLELDANNTFDGHITYNEGNLRVADFSNSTGVTSFLGSATGGGFLGTVTDLLKKVQDTTTGLLKTSETEWQSQITKLGATIADKQNKVSQLQLRLQNQMAASDALIASMEQQASYFSSMFAAQQTADQMYK